jgi:hypothetical protein
MVRHEERENERRALEKKVADLLDIDVEWSNELRHWYFSGKVPEPDADDTHTGEFSPLDDPAIAIRIMTEFRLSTESSLGSFVAAGTNRHGRKVFGRTESNSIIEVICQVAVNMQE